MRVSVSLMYDVCLPLPASMTIHAGPCVESPTPMMWFPGLVLQQNKLTKTVFHKSQFIVLGGHDCGHMIPHVTIPASPMSLLYTAFSARKVTFASSKVKANGAPIGCTEIFTPYLPLPMSCCASPVPLPIGFPAFNWLNTVSVGLSQRDIAAGFFAIACNIVSKLIRSLKWFKGGYDGLARELVGAANFRDWVAKNIFASLSGAAKIVLTGDGNQVRLDLGSGYAGMRLSWKTSPDDRLKAEREYQLVPIQVALAHSDKRDGTSSDQSAVNLGSPVGTSGYQQTKTYDRDGTLVKQQTQTTSPYGDVDVRDDYPTGTAAKSGQHTLPADDRAASAAAGRAASSSPASSWGMPL